jgi:fluoroquinolone transport system permease protein
VSQLAATLKLDVRIQARVRLYAVGIFVAILLGCVGRFLIAADYAGRVLVLFYLTGLGGTTFMFSASLVLLEKSDGTLQALRATPLTSTTYIASKVITLTCFALIESAIVYVLAFFGVPLNPVPLLLGVVLLSVLYTLVGLGQVASHDSVTAFLFPGAMIVTAIMQLPVLYLVAPELPLPWLVPTQGSLLLMLAASEVISTWQWVYAIVVSLVAIALAYWWTKIRFAKLIGLQEQ